MVREGGGLDFKPVPGTDVEMEVDLVLLAMGFLGSKRNGMLVQLRVEITELGHNPYLMGHSDLPSPLPYPQLSFRSH